MLAILDIHSKIPKARWLKQQKCTFSEFWRSQSRWARVSSQWGPSPQLGRATSSSLHAHMAFPRHMHVGREKKRELSGACPYKDTGLSRILLGFPYVSVLFLGTLSVYPPQLLFSSHLRLLLKHRITTYILCYAVCSLCISLLWLISLSNLTHLSVPPPGN